jgi:hypothetical protein
VIGVGCSTTNSLDRQRRPHLEQDALLALWQEGVPLGNAWLVLTDERNTTRFHELQRTDSHLELQRLLKADLIGRLRDGKNRALGVQEGGDPGLVLIHQYYFSKTAEVDWENDKITTAGKTFHAVKVQWEREPPEEGRPPKPTQWIHSRELEALLDLGPETEPGPFIDPFEDREWEPLDDMVPNEPPPGESSEFGVQSERDLPRDRPQSEPTPSQKRPRGRPQIIPIVREVIRELIDQKKFISLNGKEIEQLVRREAKVRFPAKFPHPTQPSPTTILGALKEEGWPPSPKNPKNS